MSTPPESPALKDDQTESFDLDNSLELRCPKCDYQLRGITGQRCPECGLEIEKIRGKAHTVPWIRRHDLGRFRAFWATVILVMFQSRWLRCDLHRPARWSDSQLFRVVISIHALLAFIFLTGALVLVSGSYQDFREWGEGVGWWFVATCVFSTWLSILLITGTPAYFFHPKRLEVDIQNRAVALSNYACAPLAWMPVMPLVSFLYHLFIGGDSDLEVAIWLIGVIWPLILLLLFWLDALRLAKHLTARPAGAMVRMGLFLPLIWLVIMVFIGVGIPAITSYSVLMGTSMWNLAFG